MLRGLGRGRGDEEVRGVGEIAQNWGVEGLDSGRGQSSDRLHLVGRGRGPSLREILLPRVSSFGLSETTAWQDGCDLRSTSASTFDLPKNQNALLLDYTLLPWNL